MQKNKGSRSNTFTGPSTSSENVKASEPLLINRSTSLPSPEQVKQFLNNLKNNITNIARSLTIFGPRTQGVPRGYSRNESLSTIVSINGLTIEIGLKYFKLVSKYVLFDRRYVDFNVYNSDPNNNARVEPIHRLTAYASSSQVGAWRLCKSQDGTRLLKFDDYVQSTVIHVILAKFICEKFYTQELLWADEEVEEDDPNSPTYIRNQTRNNLIAFRYNISKLPVSLSMPQLGTPAAIPVYYVMEDRQYAYKTYPIEYLTRTQDDSNITEKIVERGLTEPCPFNYWIDKGTCGDNIAGGEPEIKRQLDEFSRQMDAFYNIETNQNPQGQEKMKITELYKDCMVYKNFKQSATIFKVRLTPKLFARSGCESAFKKQEITIVFVQYTIKQWNNERYEPRECNDEKAEVSEPDIEIPGYYILTIIPTRGKIKTLLSSTEINIDFNTITDIGLFVQYIKAGFYACKPLDYKRQCDMSSFIEEEEEEEEEEVGKKRSIGKIPRTINYEYVSIANRLNYQFPFFKLFGFDSQMREVLKKYNENPIIISGKTPILGIRTLTTTGDMKLLQIANIEDEVAGCSEPLRRTDNNVIGKKKQKGGTNKQNKTNKKQYRNKLHTNKIRKCKKKKKRTTKKQRMTKKRRI